MNSRVGTNLAARREFAIADKFGAGQDFAGDVQTLTNTKTINTLIDMKRAGATMGSLQEKELDVLQKAATKINAWEIKDENGIGIGEWDISEKLFKKELNNLKTLALKAIALSREETGLEAEKTESNPLGLDIDTEDNPLGI